MVSTRERNSAIQKRRADRRRKQMKKRKRRINILSWLLIIVIALLPVTATVFLQLLIMPLLIFDVIWFAATLITFIWIFK